ncbi:MAG: Kelch repeat-containing protein, partial [Halothiobacillaceae bacterium]
MSIFASVFLFLAIFFPPSFVHALCVPTPVTNLAITLTTSTRLDFSWDNESGCQYDMVITTMSNWSWLWITTGTSVADANTTSYASLLANTTYYFRVKKNIDPLDANYQEVSTNTWIESIVDIRFDEVLATTITASAYTITPGFSGLSADFAGIKIGRNDLNPLWSSGGDVWTTRANIPTGRARTGAAPLAGRAYVIGGLNAGAVVAVNEEYDPVANSWATRAPMSTARCAVGVVSLMGRIYAIGGDTDNSCGGVVITQANEIYDPVVNSWTSGANMPTARMDAGAVALSSTVFVIAGNGGANTENEEYDPLSD